MSSTTAPASPKGRIEVIDAIRGLAILGILLANIMSWSGYKYIPFSQIESLPLFSLESSFYTLDLWLVDGKFYSIFSILFGVGFGIQYLKNRENQEPFLKVYRRRLAFLIMFGVLHALLWSGDILSLYGMLAFVLVMLRNLSDRQVFGLSMVLFLFFVLTHSAVMLLGIQPDALDPIAHKNYPDMAPEAIIAGFGNGSWGEVFSVNMHNLYWRWIDFLPNGRISRVLALFLLGFYLARIDYFRGPVFQWWRIPVYLVIGLAFTGAGYILGGNISSWARSPIDLFEKVMIIGGQVTLALGYISILAVIFNRPLGRRLLHPLTLIGRMAFTNYLLHSVVGITIFYGVGFGLFGTMGLAQLWMLAVGIFAGQVLLSSVWLRIFKQGPVEWLWRCLTQGKLVPNLRR
jgi:uncharacterized protein